MKKEEEMQSVHLSKLVKMPTKIYQIYGWNSNLQEIHFKRILLQSKLLVENNILKTFSKDLIIGKNSCRVSYAVSKRSPKMAIKRNSKLEIERE